MPLVKQRSRLLLFGVAGTLFCAGLLLAWGTASATSTPHLGAPPIADGVSCEGWPTSCVSASHAFTHILLDRFPLGTSEITLRHALVAQGFRPDAHSVKRCLRRGEQPPLNVWVVSCPPWDQNWDPRNFLRYDWGGLPCENELAVMWSSDKNSLLRHLEGHYNVNCL